MGCRHAHHGDDDKPRIPRWSGDPSRFQHWKDEVRVYKLSENLIANRSVAARLVGGLSGPARTVGLPMSDEDFFPVASVIPPAPLAAERADAVDVPVLPDAPGRVDYVHRGQPPGHRESRRPPADKVVKQAPIPKGDCMTKFFEQHGYFWRRGPRRARQRVRTFFDGMSRWRGLKETAWT